MSKTHEAAVEDIQNQIAPFYAEGRKVKIYHGSTTSTRIQNFKGGYIDVSRLDRVIQLNAKDRFILVEPNVPMDVLVAATLKEGLVPPVVPEFPGITVGGSIQGGAGESSSFRYGGFHNACMEYEMILGNGERIVASPEKNAALFWGTACSYGSLGIITQVKLRLVPAKRFVHLAYLAVRSFEEAMALIQEKTRDDVDFIDGIMFSKDLGVIMCGNFSDNPEALVATFRKATDEWFYLHAQKIANTHDSYYETIPVEEYLFRYDRGLFWLGAAVFKKLSIPFNRFTRAIFDPWFKTRMVSRIVQSTGISQRFICQDICLPVEKAARFCDVADKRFGIYPLWLMPSRPAGNDEKLCPNYIDTKLMMDVGVWGGPLKGGFVEIVRTNRELEQITNELGGRKVLYAHQYYHPEEFWSIYDHNWYDALREKYKAITVFPDVYEKTIVKEEYRKSVRSAIWGMIIFPIKIRH